MSGKELSIIVALRAAEARLSDDGCDCGDAHDPPCALCQVRAALALDEDASPLSRERRSVGDEMDEARLTLRDCEVVAVSPRPDFPATIRVSVKAGRLAVVVEPTDGSFSVVDGTEEALVNDAGETQYVVVGKRSDTGAGWYFELLCADYYRTHDIVTDLGEKQFILDLLDVHLLIPTDTPEHERAAAERSGRAVRVGLRDMMGSQPDEWPAIVKRMATEGGCSRG